MCGHVVARAQEPPAGTTPELDRCQPWLALPVANATISDVRRWVVSGGERRVWEPATRNACITCALQTPAVVAGWLAGGFGVRGAGSARGGRTRAGRAR